MSTVTTDLPALLHARKTFITSGILELLILVCAFFGLTVTLMIASGFFLLMTLWVLHSLQSAIRTARETEARLAWYAAADGPDELDELDALDSEL